MSLSDTFIVVDSCVLLKQRVSDVLMDLRAERQFSVHWTEAIDEEFRRNLPRITGMTEARVEARLAAMKRRCPEWRIPVADHVLTEVPCQVDMRDRHVAAAALTLRRALDDMEGSTAQPAGAPLASRPDLFLITDNLKHFAPPAMARLGVTALSSGVFLDQIFATSPDATLRAVLRAASDLRNPPYTVADLLGVLAQQGAKRLARGAAAMFGISLKG